MAETWHERNERIEADRLQRVQSGRVARSNEDTALAFVLLATGRATPELRDAAWDYKYSGHRHNVSISPQPLWQTPTVAYSYATPIAYTIPGDVPRVALTLESYSPSSNKHIYLLREALWNAGYRPSGEIAGCPVLRGWQYTEDTYPFAIWEPNGTGFDWGTLLWASPRGTWAITETGNVSFPYAILGTGSWLAGMVRADGTIWHARSKPFPMYLLSQLSAIKQAQQG